MLHNFCIRMIFVLYIVIFTGIKRVKIKQHMIVHDNRDISFLITLYLM